MGVLWSPESGYVKELAKWEQRPTEQVSAGMLQALGRTGPPPFQEYPKAMYRAKAATGGPTISGFITADSAHDEQRLIRQGWATSQEAAIDAVLALDRVVATAAAERAFAERRMSPAAQAEAAAADQESPAHVPEIPSTPIRKRRAYVRKTAAGKD